MRRCTLKRPSVYAAYSVIFKLVEAFVEAKHYFYFLQRLFCNAIGPSIAAMPATPS
jgi:hypothetical protein